LGGVAMPEGWFGDPDQIGSHVHKTDDRSPASHPLRLPVVVHDCVDVPGGPVVGWMVLCPACGNGHRFEKGRWEFDGDYVKPTFSPSMLVRSGHYAPGHRGDTCWCTYNAEHPDDPDPFTCSVCHSFVRGGLIQFLSDCTHGLAGRTVPLEAW
jgi:hypothetical protein